MATKRENSAQESNAVLESQLVGITFGVGRQVCLAVIGSYVRRRIGGVTGVCMRQWGLGTKHSG